MNATGEAATPVEVPASLGFARPDTVSPDPERAGLLRAAQVREANTPASFDFQQCALRDWSAPGAAALDLDAMGFDVIDLSGLGALQSVLGSVCAAGEIGRDQAAAIRRALRGRVFRLSGGGCLRLVSVAPEGLIMRVAGPNGLVPDPAVRMDGMNGHDAAIGVHGDQDVRGTPLRQIMRGLAPWLFRHRTPDGGNRVSPLMLVNVWIGLQQVTRPLALMDRRTLDPRRHQLRYALPTDAFLEREEDTRVNDIWTFLHDDAQRWYFSSLMDSRSAYVFDTLGTPHGSTILPGEDEAERCYRALGAARSALADGDLVAARDAAAIASWIPPADCTAPLTAAIERMRALLVELREALDAGEPYGADWADRAAQAMGAVVRKSVELRAVAIRVPDIRPFNKHAM